MQRGVIFPSREIKQTNGGFALTGGISNEQIRYYLLYWDKLISPDSNIVRLGGIEEERELIELGILKRPIITKNKLSSEKFPNLMLMGQAILLERCREDKNTNWYAHQFSDSPNILPEHGSQNNVIRLDLANVLPVPAADTRIADILDFKERRSDELAALHASLDAVYLEIIKSPDVDLSKHMEIKKFLESISALNKLHNEHFKIFRNFDFSAEFNISGANIFTGAAGGAVLDVTGLFSAGMPIGTVLGGLLSALNIKITRSSTFNKGPNLVYLSRAMKEGVL